MILSAQPHSITEKVLVWYDEAKGNNMAISFQDSKGAEEVW